jgi:hypothetical protein
LEALANMEVKNFCTEFQSPLVGENFFVPPDIPKNITITPKQPPNSESQPSGLPVISKSLPSGTQRRQ